MAEKTTLLGELSKQGSWLLQACTTDVLRQMTGVKKKKPKPTRHHYHFHNHFYGNKKPRR